MNEVNTDNPIDEYIGLLKAEYSEARFELIKRMLPSSTTPTLILLDGTQDDFAEGGILSEFGKDPYPMIYGNEEFITIPKQSINVNLDGDDWKGEDPFDYLDYSMASFTGDEVKTFKYKLNVALKELLLKDFVINPRTITGKLSGYLDTEANLRQFAFVRKMTYANIGNFWILLYFENEQLHFVNLTSSSSRQKLYEIADSLGLDWDVVYTELCRKRFKSPKDKKQPKFFDVILAPQIAIEVEDIKETVLYEYDEIIARQNIRQEEFPISHFRLQHRYDDAKSDTWLTHNQLDERGITEQTNT